MRMKPTDALAIAATLLLAASPVALADDGEQTIKRLTGGSIDNQLTVLPEDVFGVTVSEAEHAFAEKMGFFVPSQAASGLVGPIDYLNADLALVETRDKAKPLINVFTYGPLAGVEETAFAHSFQDTFVGVSLDDGVTWKTTNLSESADLSSFELGMSGGGGGGGGGHHGARITVEIDAVSFEALNSRAGMLTVSGSADPGDTVRIINADTGRTLFFARSDNTTGDYENTRAVRLSMAPCRIAAVAHGETSAPFPVSYPDEAGVTCEGLDIADYPGGVYYATHAVAGNRVLVAWMSRYCQQGQPAYSYAYDADPAEDPADPLVVKRTTLATALGIDVTEDLFLTDLFGVAGSQGSIDFTDEGYPQAGEVPFGCLWTARGVLVPGDDPRTEENVEASHMVWTKPERLTSGRRDPYRLEVKGVAGAGFAMTWQEDPDGLRPGQGEGPGEGWSGAVAHPKTDVWYSFIPWDRFHYVEDPDNLAEAGGPPVHIALHDLTISGRPQAYYPFAVPMRLTNNDRCVAEDYKPGVTIDPNDPDNGNKYFSYCNEEVAVDYGLQDFCADIAEIPQGQSGDLGEICVNAEGLPNLANTGATRPRLSLQGYDRNKDGSTDSAWVIVAMEESKGLGRFGFSSDGTPCGDPESPDLGFEDDCEADIGKNQWYYSFDMGQPDSSATASKPNGLVQNLVSQGNLLNQPEVDWRTGEFYPVVNTADMWDLTGGTGDYNFDLYNTEIARRASILVQSVKKGAASSSGLFSISSWKQGAMRQGGPADTMFRRMMLPEYQSRFDDPAITDMIDVNPYDFANMECDPIERTGEADIGGWILDDGTNPYYPKGICLTPATNLSGTIPDSCIADDELGDPNCPTVDFSTSTFGIGSTNPILQGDVQGEGNTTRVLAWHQCPHGGTLALGSEPIPGCDADARQDPRDVFKTLKDQSWYNPLEVSKGHRGFIDGDFVMFLYAWSPNWRLNAKGNDRYDLYVRRSFDGGATWGTTPASFEASDGDAYSGTGTTVCQIFRTEPGAADTTEPRACWAYGAGAAEQARNVTQLTRMRTTTLDPRYAPTAPGIGEACESVLTEVGGDWGLDVSGWLCPVVTDIADLLFDDVNRDPSRYFMVYETGDNSTVDVGEAEPLDLYYSRAEVFGDHYTVWSEIDTGVSDVFADCYPSNPYADDDIADPVLGSGFCNEFDRANAGGDTHASEADLEANPGGAKLYATWTQWVFGDHEEVVESDAINRRIWWIDDYLPADWVGDYPIPNTGNE